MATIYLQEDYGEAVVINGVAYNRVAQVQQLPDTFVDGDDTTGISEVTYDIADTNGKTVYTAEEYAISLAEYYSGVFSNGVQATIIDSVPAAGVLRYGGPQLFGEVYVNSIRVAGPNAVFSASVPGERVITVAPGDHVEFKLTNGSGTCFAKHLPYVYP